MRRNQITGRPVLPRGVINQLPSFGTLIKGSTWPFLSHFFQDRKLRQSARPILILVQNGTREHVNKPLNTSASQQISSSARPTTNNNRSNTAPTPPQQQPSTTNHQTHSHNKMQQPQPEPQHTPRTSFSPHIARMTHTHCLLSDRCCFVLRLLAALCFLPLVLVAAALHLRRYQLHLCSGVVLRCRRSLTNHVV